MNIKDLKGYLHDFACYFNLMAPKDDEVLDENHPDYPQWVKNVKGRIELLIIKPSLRDSGQVLIDAYNSGHPVPNKTLAEQKFFKNLLSVGAVNKNGTIPKIVKRAYAQMNFEKYYIEHEKTDRYQSLNSHVTGQKSRAGYQDFRNS